MSKGKDKLKAASEQVRRIATEEVKLPTAEQLAYIKGAIAALEPPELRDAVELLYFVTRGAAGGNPESSGNRTTIIVAVIAAVAGIIGALIVALLGGDCKTTPPLQPPPPVTQVDSVRRPDSAPIRQRP